MSWLQLQLPISRSPCSALQSLECFGAERGNLAGITAFIWKTRNFDCNAKSKLHAVAKLEKRLAHVWTRRPSWWICVLMWPKIKLSSFSNYASAFLSCARCGVSKWSLPSAGDGTDGHSPGEQPLDWGNLPSSIRGCEKANDFFKFNIDMSSTVVRVAQKVFFFIFLD